MMLLRMGVVCCLWFACSLLSPVFGQSRLSSDQIEGLRDERPALFALVGGTVINPGVEPVPNAVILIHGARIIAVGPDLDIPPAAQQIDLSGHQIYPGLIDAWTEQSVSSTAIEQQFPYWNSQIRPQLSVANQFQIDADYNAALRKQGFVGRIVAPEGAVISGTAAFVLNADQSRPLPVVKREVAQQILLTVARGRDSYPKSPMGAVALARQAMYDADWYGRANAIADDPSAMIDNRPERNDALSQLAAEKQSRLPLLAETTNEQQALRADRFAREFDRELIILGSGNEYRRLAEIAASGRPIILPVDFPKPPHVGTREAALDVSLETLMHWDHAPENPARVAEAGLPIGFTSAGLKDASTFLQQIRVAVKRGLPEADALRALTTTPAELFGVADQLGQIAAGKLAALTITTGDLFADDTKIAETWVAGERFELSDEPTFDISGDYQVTLDGVEADYRLRITRTENAWKGQLVIPGQDAVPLTKTILNDVILSGTYRPEPQADVAETAVETWRWSVVFAENADSAVGSLVAPDGSTQSLQLTSLPGNPADQNAPNSSENEDATKPPLDPSSTFPVNYPLGGFGITQLPEAPASVLFQNATIWTCGPAGNLEQADVLIGNGLVRAIGRGLPIPDDATVIDATGLHITPGIIDCHSHMATDGGINESGQAITAEVRIGDFINCDDINIYRQLAGGVTTANILHGSANPIGGQNQVIKLRWGASDDALKFREAPQGVKFALGENVKQSNWGDEFRTRYPQTRMGVEQIFIDEFRAAQEYQARWQKWNADPVGLPPRRDLELDAIVEILGKQRWIHCHSYRQDEILALIRVLDQFQIQIGSFQHILEGYKVADAMAQHGATGSAFADWWAYKIEVYDAIPHAGALMHRQGVVVSFNSDDRELARHLNHEAAKAVKYGGVEPIEALKFVTLNPARQLRIDQYVGSLEPGKHADLVVWSGHPLSTMTRCEQTWVDGRRFFDRQESARAAQENDRMRNTLIQKILLSGAPMDKPGADDPDPEKYWPQSDLYCHGHDHDHDGHDHHGDHQH